MAYSTYITDALVCGSRTSYTSDRSYLLFTREAGMLWASARSVREERSKQRYALQDFSLIRVTLVKGRSGWRIGSVEALGNPFMSALSRQTRGHAVALVAFVRRFIHGEQAMPTVFDDVVEGFETLGTTDISGDDMLRVLSLRSLFVLGYIASERELDPLLQVPFAEALTAYTPELAPHVDRAIKRAGAVSHL